VHSAKAAWRKMSLPFSDDFMLNAQSWERTAWSGADFGCYLSLGKLSAVAVTSFAFCLFFCKQMMYYI
jgi:hypothetical protein